MVVKMGKIGKAALAGSMVVAGPVVAGRRPWHAQCKLSPGREKMMADPIAVEVFTDYV